MSEFKNLARKTLRPACLALSVVLGASLSVSGRAAPACAQEKAVSPAAHSGPASENHAEALSDMHDQVSYEADTIDTYKLGLLDKIRIKVYSWRASQDQIYEWTSINLIPDYSIGPSGTVSVPLLGQVVAAGLTIAQLSDRIGEALKDRIGMVERPDVAVEIIQFRPFYVIGDVEKPSEYPYRPNLTVLKAAAIAGGIKRDPYSFGTRPQREIISGAGELELLLAERARLQVRRARLQSELNGLDEIALPKELMSRSVDPTMKPILAQEEQIFKARLDAFSNQLDALGQLNAFLETEVESLTAQIKAQETEVQAVAQELESIRALAEKKLTTDSRRLGLERTKAQEERERLRLQSDLMRVKQDIGKTAIAIIELRNKRTTEVTTDISATEARLDQLEQKIITTRDLLSDSDLIGSPDLEIKYKIVRDGDQLERPAEEGSPVGPGDTVKVEAIRRGGRVILGPVSIVKPFVTR